MSETQETQARVSKMSLQLLSAKHFSILSISFDEEAKQGAATEPESQDW